MTNTIKRTGVSSTPRSNPEPAAAKSHRATKPKRPAAGTGDSSFTPSLPLGATVQPNGSGTGFKVWAPNAAKVFVVGDFNHWKPTTELTRNADGSFSGVLPEAKPGQNYRFLLQDADGTQSQKIDPAGRQLTKDEKASTIYDAGAFKWSDTGFKPPAAQKQVLYELHLGSFNPKPGEPAGTWKDALEKLDHLESLGINTIEVMPPTATKSGPTDWGYGPDSLYAPEPAFGSPDDVKKFVDAAHAKGIAVVMDWVPNHFASNSGVVGFDKAGKYGSYFYGDDRANTPYGPRPDLSNPNVRDWLKGSLLTWLDDYHFDGVRVDSTSTLRRAGPNQLPEAISFLKDVTQAVHARGKTIIAEDLSTGREVLTRPTDKGGVGMDAQWNDQFFWAVRHAVTAKDDGSRNIGEVAKAISSASLDSVIYTDNHDKADPVKHAGGNRTPTAIDPANPDSDHAKALSALAYSLGLVSPGRPMLLQGQELNQTQGFDFGNPPPVDWAREPGQTGIEKLQRDLISLREQLPALQNGKATVFHQNDKAKVLAFTRSDGNPADDVVVLVNMSGKGFADYKLGLPDSGQWKVAFNGRSKQYGFDGFTANSVTATAGNRDGQPNVGDVSVGPYSVVVLKRG